MGLGVLAECMWQVEGRWPGGTEIICEDHGGCWGMGSLAGNVRMVVAKVMQGEAMHAESSRNLQCRLCSAGLFTKS